MRRNYFLAAAAMTAAVLVGTLVVYPQLPARVPMHWDANNQVNGWGPKWMLPALVPGMMATMTLLFSMLPWLSPKHFEVEGFRSTYLYLMLVVLGVMAYIQALLLWADLGGGFDMGRALMGGISLLFALMGNVMGKVRRNFYVGVRTPWTLANERVWNATHRFAAKSFVVCGLAGFAGAALKAPFWFPLNAILIGALSPVVYSLIFYKRLEAKGQLEPQG